MDFIAYAFILIYCSTAIKVSIVLFIVCNICPKYILYSINLYDLGNSPVAYNIPIENFICTCYSNLIRISNC